MAVFLVCIGIFCLAQQPRAYWQSTNYNVAISGGAAYAGPGDIVGGFNPWWGLRGYTAAYSTGSNPAADICDASTGLTCSTINILSNGKFDTATAAGSSACTVACRVSKLYDQTGNGNHLLQATNSNRPTLTFNCVNTNLPCMVFGGGQLLKITTFTQAQPFSIVVSGDETGGAGRHAVVGGSAGGIVLGFRSGSGCSIYAGGENTSACADNAWHTFQGAYNNASSTWSIDGTNIGTITTGTDAFAAASVCMGDDCNSNNLTGNIFEGGIISGAMSNANQLLVNTNQCKYLGLC